MDSDGSYTSKCGGTVPFQHDSRGMNFTYSYDVALNGANPPLANYQAWLLIDLDRRRRRSTWPEIAKLAPYPALPCAPSRTSTAMAGRTEAPS